MSQTIVLHSAGSVAVTATALLFALFQHWCFRKQPAEEWLAWGAGLSLSASIYAAAVAFQYNAAPGPLNLLCERIQYTAIVWMLYAAQGFTVTFLGIRLGSAVRGPLTAAHAIALILVWATPWIIGDRFIARRFLWLDRPYHEPVLGILGPLMVAYCAGVIVFVLASWIRRRPKNDATARFFLMGLFFWALLAVHDAAATLGFPTVMFVLEYGFFGFSAAVLLATASRALDLEGMLIGENDRMATVIQSIGEGFVATDARGRIIMYNKKAAQLCGWQKQRIIGKPLEEAYRVVRSGRQAFSNGWMAEAIRSGGNVRGKDSVRIAPLDGPQRRVSQTVTPIRSADGEISGVVILFHPSAEPES